jgi:hypothetical protein
MATEPTGGHRRSAMISWQHRSGGQARALARLVALPAPERPVIVLSELASNSDVLGLVTDFSGAVSAALTGLRADLAPASIRWFAHHGDFSSYDAQGAPETFTEIEVRFAAGQLQSDLKDQRLVTPAQTEALNRRLRLDPVADVLAALRRQESE